MAYKHASRALARAAATDMELIDDVVIRQDPDGSGKWGWDDALGTGTSLVTSDTLAPNEVSEASVLVVAADNAELVEHGPTIMAMGETILSSLGLPELGAEALTPLDGEALLPTVTEEPEGLDEESTWTTIDEVSNCTWTSNTSAPSAVDGPASEDKGEQVASAVSNPEMTVQPGDGEATTPVRPALSVVATSDPAPQSGQQRQPSVGDLMVQVDGPVRLMAAAALATRMSKLGYAVTIRNAVTYEVVEEVPADPRANAAPTKASAA